MTDADITTPPSHEAYRLPPELDLAAAESLAAALRALLPDGPIRVDGGAVERAMTPCLQVLAAAAATARARGIVFRLEHPSAAMVDAIEDLGLGKALEGDR
ncbi:STAS domain-containing protein [Falsiroseomonas stagni]|uniref:Anti-anti-sigma regulatory factor (Antagonist of anti-sigma factor) n=1 Tax=Falsiroseomonas stagni DSM 19981 TaxID=1123062 RepID=A0A1I3X9V4_9PROT|nr:STAS domain-containing protein [Falsiroseomonas stagni]SFK16413.1 Anti-anti-sigma regulatory factor (antagonist of anti-sigma factor) [Falsiroseomonas stagni DSM 19981]